MLRVVLVFLGVTTFLALEIHLVLLDIGVEHVVSAHAENLRKTDEKVKQIHDLDARVLLVELLILGPPFPRDAVGQFGDLLRHGAGVIENPLGLFLFAHAFHVDANTFVQGVLHAPEFAELIRFFHRQRIKQTRPDASSKRFDSTVASVKRPEPLKMRIPLKAFAYSA